MRNKGGITRGHVSNVIENFGTLGSSMLLAIVRSSFFAFCQLE